MAKSVRQQRLAAIDDLRDMADAMEQAAELFEETLGDLDSVNGNGGSVARTGKHLPYEALGAELRLYRHLSLGEMNRAIHEHVRDDGDHDPEICEICEVKRNPTKGWLVTWNRKILRAEIRAMLEEGDEQMAEFAATVVRDSAPRATTRA